VIVSEVDRELDVLKRRDSQVCFCRRIVTLRRDLEARTASVRARTSQAATPSTSSARASILDAIATGTRIRVSSDAAAPTHSATARASMTSSSVRPAAISSGVAVASTLASIFVPACCSTLARVFVSACASTLASGFVPTRPTAVARAFASTLPARTSTPTRTRTSARARSCAPTRASGAAAATTTVSCASRPRLACIATDRRHLRLISAARSS
jgi:hypothetical protein